VTTSVSSKTSYVIVGLDPGASKMDKITQHKIRTVDEDQFYDMIRTRPGQAEKAAKSVAEYREAKAREEKLKQEKEREQERSREREREREKEREKERERAAQREKEKEKEKEKEERPRSTSQVEALLETSHPVSPPPVSLVAKLSPSSPPERTAATDTVSPHFGNK